MPRLNTRLSSVWALDPSSYLPGPFASLLLVACGLGVLNIMPPQADGTPLLGPHRSDVTGLLHATLGAGNTIRGLALKTANSKTALRALICFLPDLIMSRRHCGARLSNRR